MGHVCVNDGWNAMENYAKEIITEAAVLFRKRVNPDFMLPAPLEKNLEFVWKINFLRRVEDYKSNESSNFESRKLKLEQRRKNTRTIWLDKLHKQNDGRAFLQEHGEQFSKCVEDSVERVIKREVKSKTNPPFTKEQIVEMVILNKRAARDFAKDLQRSPRRKR